MKQVILLATHFQSEIVLSEYLRLKQESPSGADVVLLYDATSSEPPHTGSDVDIFSFQHSDIHDLIPPVQRLRLGMGRIFPRDVTIFSIMHFRRRHGEYDFYWFLEHDVRFSGRWSRLFDHFRRSPADLLTTNVHRYAIWPDLHQWRFLKGSDPLEKQEMIRGLLSFHRLSSHALQEIESAYQQGWRGHWESLVPSVLARKGLVLEDIGGRGEFVRSENENLFYTSTPGNPGLSPGTFVYRPVLREAGHRPNTLWHPVKTLQTPPRWEEKPRGLAGRLLYWIKQRLW